MNTAETPLTALLHSYTHAEHGTVTERFVTTRTGKRIHAQSPGSSVTRCGHWQKASSAYFEVEPSGVRAEHLCGSCFPSAHAQRDELEAAAAAAADEKRQAAVREAALGKWDAYDAINTFRSIARKAGAPSEVQKRLMALASELADLDPESWA